MSKEKEVKQSPATLGQFFVQQAAPGWSGLRSPNTGKVIDPTYRDMAHVMPVLCREAITYATDIINEASDEDVDKEAMLALDILSKFVIKVWEECKTASLTGLPRLAEMHTVMAKVPKGPEVTAIFTAGFFQTYFVYLFTVTSMRNGMELGWDEEFAEMQSALHMASMLEGQTRIDAMGQILERGMWPNSVDCSALRRQVEDYMPIIEAEHQKHVGEADAQPNE